MSVYLLHLLYRSPPVIDGDALLAGLRRRCGSVDRMGDGGKLEAFAFLDHIVEYADGRMPAQGLVTAADSLPDSEVLEAALQQTWDWDGAAEAVAGCTCALVVSDFCAPPDGAARLAIVHGLVRSALAAAPGARAIVWSPAGRLVEPDDYLASLERAPPDPLAKAVNVRMFNVSGRRDGEVVMDTLGFELLGLPDVQCHFIDLDPGRVAGFLHGVARYQFARGGVLEDGDSVPGPEGQKWRVRLEESLVAPQRAVLDVEPHGRHSAR